MAWSRVVPFAGVATALLLAGCGGQTIVRTVTAAGQHTSATNLTAATSTATAAAAASTATASSTTSSSHSTARQAKVGDTLTLRGSNGEVMDVTVDGVMDPLAVGVDDVTDSGQRFIGVQITLRNVGSTPYSDSPSNGATLLSDTDEQATSETVTGGPCGNDFQSSANIAPGDEQQGCVPFELPVGETASNFQFTLDSGFANQTGQWSLAGADDAAASTSTSATTIATATVAAPTSAAPSTSAGQGPVAAVKDYWADIGSHRFGPAFFCLAGTQGLTESGFVAGERQAKIVSVSFSGRVVAGDAADATVEISSLITHDHEFGCRSWSGSYAMASNQGQWRIVKASITPTSCN